jgi:hypothetical protein
MISAVCGLQLVHSFVSNEMVMIRKLSAPTASLSTFQTGLRPNVRFVSWSSMNAIQTQRNFSSLKRVVDVCSRHNLAMMATQRLNRKLAMSSAFLANTNGRRRSYVWSLEVPRMPDVIVCRGAKTLCAV